MPVPEGSFSMLLMPRGFRISKKRKRTKASNIHQYHPSVAADGQIMSGIHTPTISSTTTFEGSCHQTASTFPDDQIPITVNKMVTTIVVVINTEEEHVKAPAIHKSVASKAPIVPGANGESPDPNPVAITLWNRSTFIFLFIYIYIINNYYRHYKHRAKLQKFYIREKEKIKNCCP